MRFTRLESKIRSGGVIRSRTTIVPRASPKTSEAESKPKPATPARKKRAKAEDYESESAVSTDEDMNKSEGEGDIKEEEEGRTLKCRTRGVQQDLKCAFESSDGDSESSSDDYDEAVVKNENSDDDISDTETTPMAQATAKNSGSGRRFSRSDGPPMTPGRFVRSERPSYSPLSPTSIHEGILKTPSVGETSEMTRDQQIKIDLSTFKDGMMLSATFPPSLPNTSRKLTTGNTSYVEKSAIFQSIEHDDDEEEGSEVGSEIFESADEEMGEGGDGDDESDNEVDKGEAIQSIVQKGAMGPLPVPAPKTSMSYFGWMRTAVNGA